MKIPQKLLAGLILGVCVAACTTWAVEITMPDGVGSGTGWYSASREDQEVEPNTTANQIWDMEGFHLAGNVLTMVGGYNLKNGGWDSGTCRYWMPGDIFFDVDEDVQFGVDMNGTKNGTTPTIKNDFGYDYVLRPNYTTEKFAVWKINSDSMLYDSYYKKNQKSDPWRLDTRSAGVELVMSDVDFDFTTWFATTKDLYGYLGGRHYGAAFDLSELEFLSNPGHWTTMHFTMECGNDNLMGHWYTPDAPSHSIPDGASTVTLLGLALTGVAVFAHRLKG